MVVIAVTSLNSLSGTTLDSFSQVKVVPAYSEVLQKLDLILEVGGGKIIKMPDGSIWVAGIGTTEVKTPLTGAEILRQRRVAEQKARKAAAEQLHATEVASLTKSLSVELISSEDRHEQSKSIENFEESIEAKVGGIVRNLELAGTWYSADGQIFYLALCNRLK